MNALEAIAERWSKAWDDRGRADALGDLFRAALRDRSRAILEGASRALGEMGIACDDEGARVLAFERALCAIRGEPRTPWTLEILARLAAHHPPAFADALAAARERGKSAAKKPSGALLRRAGVETLASLVAVAPSTDRTSLFAEALEAARETEYSAFNVPYLLARASPGIGPIAPQVLLDAIAGSDPHYRALAYALVAKDLSADVRRRTIATALSDPSDPSLGDARPFVALAPWLDAESLPRALELARGLYPSPSSGAAALAALLPAWAALGHVEEAAAEARAIPTIFERAVALGNIAARIDDELVRDAFVLEVLALLDDPDAGPSGLAALADGLVPHGYGSLIVDAKYGRHALFAVARAATGEERARWIERVGKDIEPRHVVTFGRELDPRNVFPRWFGALRGAAEGEDFFENECGEGLVDWMCAVPLLGGGEGVRQVVDAVHGGS
jgi:hypothetical protein